MKLLSLMMMILTFSQISFASDLPLCETKNSVKFGKNVNGSKVTVVKGPMAQAMYATLKAKEVSSTSLRLDTDPNDKVKVKTLAHQTCLKVQPARYLDNEYLGMQQCLSYRCQILED